MVYVAGAQCAFELLTFTDGQIDAGLGTVIANSKIKFWVSITSNLSAHAHFYNAGLQPMGKEVRLVGREALPHGALLSEAALQGRSLGQRNATGPITVPSAPSPWADSAWRTSPMRAKREVVGLKNIFGFW
jgi:hypothetical protein